MLPLKNLLRRKARSLFAVLQIAVAIAAFIAIWGVSQGLRAQFYKIGQVFAYDIVVQTKGSPSPMFSKVTRADKARIMKAPGVKDISLLGLYFMKAPVEAKLEQPVGFLAVDPGSEVLARYTILRGRTLQEGDTNQILIGEIMVQTLKIDARSLTDKGVVGEPPVVKFNDGAQEYQVVGIFKPPIQDIPFLKGQALMSLPYYQKKCMPEPQMAFVHLNPGVQAETPDDVKAGLALAESVVPNLTEALSYTAKNGKTYQHLQAKTIKGLLDSFKQAELVDAFALAIVFLTALVSGIGVANTMLMSVFDRTREIGLLRAIGWSRLRIIVMIESEGVLLAIGGGLLGLPIGLGLIEASGYMIKLGWLDVSLDAATYFQAVGAAVVIGLVGSFYPAVRASYLQPTEALRYE